MRAICRNFRLGEYKVCRSFTSTHVRAIYQPRRHISTHAIVNSRHSLPNSNSPSYKANKRNISINNLFRSISEASRRDTTTESIFSQHSSMAAVASMMTKAPTGLNYGAVQRNSVGHINRLPHSNLQVKCMAKDRKETSSTEGGSPFSNTKVSRKFGDLFAFSGPVPEIVNGRAAMLGFVSAIAVEAASGRDLWSQLNSGGVSWFVLSALVLSVGTLVPLSKGISTESRSQQIFSSSAEMLNGRFAMLGLLALAFTEYVKGGPLV